MLVNEETEEGYLYNGALGEVVEFIMDNQL